MHAYGARALGLGGRGNGEPLTSGCRASSRSESRSACCRSLHGGAHGRTPASAEAQRVGLITRQTRLSIYDMDRRSGMYKRGTHLVSSLRSPPGAPATICLSVPMAWEISQRPSTCRDGTAWDTALAAAQRQQHSPGGIDPLEHGWIVHSQWARPCESRGGGRYVFLA